MAESERVKTTRAHGRVRKQWLVLVTAATSVFLLLPATVTSQQVECYYCDAACDQVIPDQIERCAILCAVWYSSVGNSIEVYRGCFEYAPDDAEVYELCEENLCNDATLVRCLSCDSVDSNECEEAVCSNEEDQCYLNRADGKRGCTSDPTYEEDCLPESGQARCSLCTPTSGRSCNENIRCVVCDESSDETCPQDPGAVEACPSSTDQCFRYLDSLQTLHMGCTSSPKYQTNCNQPRNCRTCTTNECNRDDVFACYSCSDCYSVDKSVLTPVECTIFETNRCYVGYDWQEQTTYRGCASQELLPFDAADLCYESGCNGDDFPVHLQCYQCVGCDQISLADVNYCQSESATGCFMLLSGPDADTRTLIRGCNTDAAYDECREEQNCVTCSGDGCNGGPKTVPIFCTQCSGVEQCEQSAANTYSCSDLTFYNRCYMYSVAGGTLEKGCLLDAEPESEVATACYDSDDSRCQYCVGFGCNQQHCVSCDSRIDGVACIVGLSSGALRYEMCSGDAAGCRMIVAVEGYTVRGCVDPQVDPCEATVDCTLTQLSGSNGDLFPPQRLLCYKCSGDELCSEQQDATSEQYCPLYYGANDGCYIYNDGSTVVRGCTTDPDARCQTADDPACRVSSVSLSNGAAALEPISCYQNCPGGDTSELVPSCPPVTCSTTDNRCFLSVSITGVISRGCTNAAQGCPLDSRDCFVCNEPNCNGVYAVCATCDTALNADCTVAEEHGDVCEGVVGCFHYVDGDREIFGCAERAPTICTDDADHCQFCQEEAFCNGKALSLCYSCTDCDEVNGMAVVDTKICPADTCFTGLFGTRIDRGCYSEMPEPIEQYRELENCAEPFLCNNLARSDWASCYVCANCAGEPSADASQLCLNPPSNRCYTVLGEDGLVQRGCVGDALPEGCVEEVNCAVCTGEDNCNGRAANGIPTPESPGFSCVRCEGETCSDYNQVTVCPNERGLLFDGCVTYVDGTADVKKGCLSDGALWELCAGNDGLCTVSDFPNGNARPISCFTCSGATSECVQQQLQGAVTAVFEHGGCVVFIQNDGTIVRDNAYDGRSCASNGASLCTECYTDGCNGQLFPSDRLHCYQCRGEDCAQLSSVEGSSIAAQPCLRYDETGGQCYTRFEGALYAERGCRSDDGVCADPGDSCQLCDEDGCNDGGFQESATCLSCSSNLACDTNPTVETCSDPSQGCYTFFSGLFVIAKGCVSDVNPSSAWYNDCTPAGGNERCQHCTGDNCNGNRCFVCSSRDGESCFEPRIGLVESSACPTEECMAFIDDNGHVVRGCAIDYTEQTAADCSEGSETCLQCVGDHCNGGPVPRNRIKCYQCTGSGMDCLAPPKDNAKYCPTYEKDGVEGCYTYFADENTVERGCVAERETDCGGNCQQCSTTECNDQPALMPNTLRCVQCDGVEDCGRMTNVPEPCSGQVLFGRSDRCYTLFNDDDDDDGAVSGRGCLSQLTEPGSVRCQDREDATCKLCSPDGCNSASVECIVCDSETNPACAGELLPGSSERQCGTGRCVSLVQEAITRKGCAEDFETECASQDEEGGAMCAIFEGNLSNRGIFPEDRLQCYRCKGGRNNCGLLGNAIHPEACQWYNPTDECFTYVADSGETIRGCLSDPAESKECTENPSHCIQCPAEGCNTAPSEQPNWLSCAKCSQAAECTARDGNPVFERCTGVVLLGRHDSCYSYAFGDETLARGCLSEADPTIRARCPVEGSSECSVCHCDRCNGPPGRCIVCQDGEGCGDVQGAAGRLEDCRTGSCVAFAKQPIDGSDALTIVKGCSEDYEAETCTRGPPDEYHVCQSTGCNDLLFPAGRIRCYQCQGVACADPSLQATVCEPYVASNDVCYSFLDRQQKGCVGQLSDVERTVCLEGDGTECKVCSTEDGCNVEPRVQQCTVCSSQTDPGCADSEWTGIASPTRKPCPTGGCATFIDADGFTVKDCAADHQLTDASCTGTLFCFVCTTGDGCNDGLRFPADRQECFQCSGAGCVDVALRKPTACQRYDPTDACYTYALGPSSVERGCLSDRPSCAEEACVTCTTPSTGCNTDPALVPNEHSCYQCTGGVECAQGQTGPGVACSAPILLGRTDACYTFVDTSTVRRGCLSEEGACDPSDSSCHVCTTGIDCNGDEYEVATHQCIQCDESSDGEACRWGYSATEAIHCPEESTPSNSDGCYSCYEDATAPTAAGGPPLFRRGCVGDAGQQRCRDDTTLAVCLGTGCNNRNERLQICAKCDDVGCDADKWIVEECRGTVPYLRRGCYLLRDTRKRILARGCVAELSESDWQRCLNVRDGSCTTCLENQCNRANNTLGGAGRMAGLAAVLTILFFSTFLQP